MWGPHVRSTSLLLMPSPSLLHCSFSSCVAADLSSWRSSTPQIKGGEGRRPARAAATPPHRAQLRPPAASARREQPSRGRGRRERSEQGQGAGPTCSPPPPSAHPAARDRRRGAAGGGARPEQGLPVERSEAGERSRMRRRGVGCRGAEQSGAAAEGAPARNEEERPPWPARKRRSGGRRGRRRRGRPCFLPLGTALPLLPLSEASAGRAPARRGRGSHPRRRAAEGGAEREQGGHPRRIQECAALPFSLGAVGERGTESRWPWAARPSLAPSVSGPRGGHGVCAAAGAAARPWARVARGAEQRGVAVEQGPRGRRRASRWRGAGRKAEEGGRWT